jgi:hypothetical protein
MESTTIVGASALVMALENYTTHLDSPLVPLVTSRVSRHIASAEMVSQNDKHQKTARNGKKRGAARDGFRVHFSNSGSGRNSRPRNSGSGRNSGIGFRDPEFPRNSGPGPGILNSARNYRTKPELRPELCPESARNSTGISPEFDPEPGIFQHPEFRDQKCQFRFRAE